ncbi:MAG: insulinase family protein [Nocardioidaceae bacterium]|nr:insulinase family protein [Nocardioidaceae bacterium]
MTTQLTPPVVRPADNWKFPEAAEDQLSNGIRVLAYQCPGQYVIAASLLFDIPLDVEPPDKEGVAAMAARCLSQGAAGRSAEEFADALALCGADLGATASHDAFTVHLSTPVPHLDKALRLMADVVESPAFDQQEFEHERQLRLQEIEQASAYPQHVAGEQLNAALFGDSRAARPTGGSAETVEAIERDDVVTYARDHLQPVTATMIIAGDFGNVDPIAQVAQAFEAWRHIGRPATARKSVEISDSPQVVLIDWPDSPQSTLRVAGRAVTRDDARWQALFVANHAVGGSFSSRINTVLREEKGVTYGASSALETSRRSGVLNVSTAVRADATAEAVADIVEILTAATGTLTDDEVATAVRAATESAALGFERAEAVTSRVEMLLAQGLPPDHVDYNLARLREVTTEAANTAYTNVVEADQLTVVVVGEGDKLREPLASWGYATVREVSPKQR